MGKLYIEVFEEDWYLFIDYMKKLGTFSEQIAFNKVMKTIKELSDEEGQE